MKQNGKKSRMFSQADLDILRKKMDRNYVVLLGNSAYLDIDIKLTKLIDKLNILLNESELKLFNEYLDINEEAINYQNCLAYYLGIKAGLEMNKIN